MNFENQLIALHWIAMQKIALEAIQEIDEEEDDLDLDLMKLSLNLEEGSMDVSTDDEESIDNNLTDGDLSGDDDDEDYMNEVRSNEPPPKKRCI